MVNEGLVLSEAWLGIAIGAILWWSTTRAKHWSDSTCMHLDLVRDWIAPPNPAARAGDVGRDEESTGAVLRKAGISFPAGRVLERGLPKDSIIPRRANRYLANQFKRLEWLSKERKARPYWAMATRLLLKSRVFRVAMLLKAMPWCYRKMTEHALGRCIKLADQRLREWDPNVETARVYIPKADGIRVRSLGVPAKEWRPILTGWTTFLAIWLRPLMSPWQHGGQPGKGPATAWAVVLRRVLPSNFIYEYDLKAFFNSFYLWKLHEALEKSGLPESINQHVYNMNDNDATPPTSEDIHDSDPELAEYEVRDYRYGGGVNRQRVREAFLVGEGQTGPNRLRRHWSQSPLKGITQGVNWGPALATFLLESSGLYTPWQPPMAIPGDCLSRVPLGTPAELIDVTKWAIDHNRVRVLPGEAWAPHYGGETWETLQFIDDGLYYGDMPGFPAHRGLLSPVGMLEENIVHDSLYKPPLTLSGPGEVEPEFKAMGLCWSDKPGVVGFAKHSGNWMKDSFKFLGVTYWPASDEITGRNGLKVPRKVLTNMLDDGEIKEFQKTIAGLNPDYATVPETVDPPVEVEPDSWLGKECRSTDFTSAFLPAFGRGLVAISTLFILWDCSMVAIWPELEGTRCQVLGGAFIGAWIYAITWEWYTLPTCWYVKPFDTEYEWYYIDLSAASTSFAVRFLPKVIRNTKIRGKGNPNKA